MVTPAVDTDELRMPSVAIFADTNPLDRNGVGVTVDQLERHIRERGLRPLVVSPSHNGGGDFTRDGHVNLPSRRFSALHPRVAVIVRRRKYARRIDDARPDIVHIHGFGLCSLLGIYVARTRSIPLVVTWHTDVQAYVLHYLAPGRLASRIGRLLAKSIEKRILGRAHIVIAPSSKTAKDLAKLRSRAPIVTIPAGVDRLESRASQRSNSALTLLYVGRVTPEKGIGLLLAALDLVRESIPDATLSMVGQICGRRGSVRSLLRAAARSSATLVGEVARNELASYYATADIFVFPSTTDTQGLVLHEAAHAGLPIVSADRSLDLVIKEGVNGAFAEPNAESLAHAILEIARLQKNKNWRQRAQSTGRELAALYPIASQADAIIRQYFNVLESSEGERRLNDRKPNF